MGYTGKTIELIDIIIDRVQTVVDLGAQNDYRHPTLPAPYVKDTYYANKNYVAFDISGENGSEPYDLSLLHDFGVQYDLLVDAGTSEHVGDNGKFGWRAIYNCWKNKHNLVKVGGYIISENPKTGNWPGHGFNYYTEEFYQQLASVCGYNLLSVGSVAAMGNYTDGWNVYSVLQKNKETFCTLDEFKTCGIKTN
jgi:hypothetical protein